MYLQLRVSVLVAPLVFKPLTNKSLFKEFITLLDTNILRFSQFHCLAFQLDSFQQQSTQVVVIWVTFHCNSRLVKFNIVLGSHRGHSGWQKDELMINLSLLFLPPSFCLSHTNTYTVTFFFFLDGGQKIQNIQPFTKRDLEIRSLGDRIRDINHITLLYPEFPKNEVFQKFYSGSGLHTKIHFYVLKFR